MAVDANFSSLFEKLKVQEDPWLSPSTWESLTSQNASQLSSKNPNNPSSSSRSLYHLSSVSEASLVRLALNAMQGVQSALCSIQKLSAAFCSDPADRTYHGIPSLWNRSSSTHALGKILNSIGCSGSLVLLLLKFVDNFVNLNMDAYSLGRKGENSEAASNQSKCDSGMQKPECPSYSLINQAFAVSVRKVLQGYICALDTLYASVGLRHSSMSSDGLACLTAAVHSEITLLEVYLHTKELRTQIEALGNICNLHDIALGFSASSFQELTAKATLEFTNFYRGGDLLTYLYSQLQVADPAHHALLKFLFLRSCEPYCGFIRSWIFNAELVDPYDEFVVEYTDDPPCQDEIPTNFLLANMKDEVAVPCFLKDFLLPIVRAGQQLQVAKKLLELCNFVGLVDCTYEDFLPKWSGYSSDHLFGECPITFDNGDLQSMVIARNSYYQKMQEKLENLLTKLDFRYHQVVPPVSAIISYNGAESLKTADSLMAEVRAVECNDSDYSSRKDELSAFDASESSECSSLSGFEEQAETEQLTEFPNEQRYLSSLKFSISRHMDKKLQKPIQSDRSLDMERELHENCQRTDSLGHFTYSTHKKTTFGHMLVPPSLGEVNRSCIANTLCTDTLNDKCLLVSLPKNPLYGDERYGFGHKLHQCNYSSEVSRSNKGFLEEGLPYFSKMISSNDIVVTEEGFGTDQPQSDPYASNLFSLQPWKVNHDYSFLSRNPMLRKSACFQLASNPGEKHSTGYGRSLPCFDFTTVENPFKVSVGKLAPNLSSESWPCITHPVTSVGSHDEDKQDFGGDDILIDRASLSSICSPLHWKEGDHKDDSSTYVAGGRSWETMLGRFSRNENETPGCHRQNLSPTFEIPLDFIIDRCLLHEILLQYKYVSKLAIKLLEEGFDLQEHLLALRRYYFMEIADWADLFIMYLWNHKWCVKEAGQRLSEIQGFLELSVQRSSCEQDSHKDRLFVYIKGNDVMPLSTSAIGIHSFDFFGLGYRVDWPVNIVLTPGALKIYDDIFSFLIQVKLAVFSLTDVWGSLKDFMHLISKQRLDAAHEQEVDHLNTLIKIRHLINHFVSTLQQYVQSQLSHVSWCRFLHSLKHEVKDMMDLETVHMAYLTDSLRICFLSDETRSIANIIENILQCAIDFRMCVISSMWAVGQDQVELLDKLSRINISQVLAIKQKFKKNLKELHQCYLRSPKHGEFGLSSFWGYLNYNEYYSDVGNEIKLYDF